MSCGLQVSTLRENSCGPTLSLLAGIERPQVPGPEDAGRRIGSAVAADYPRVVAMVDGQSRGTPPSATSPQRRPLLLLVPFLRPDLHRPSSRKPVLSTTPARAPEQQRPQPLLLRPERGAVLQREHIGKALRLLIHGAAVLRLDPRHARDTQGHRLTRGGLQHLPGLDNPCPHTKPAGTTLAAQACNATSQQRRPSRDGSGSEGQRNGDSRADVP